MKDANDLITSIARRSDLCKQFLDSDMEIYLHEYSYEMIEFVQKASECFPDLEKPDHNIHAALNIAYDHGFNSALMMIAGIIEAFQKGGAWNA